MGGQVGPHCLDVRPAAGEISGCRSQFAVLGSDGNIETVGGELTGQLTADTAGRTGDDGKRS